MPRRKSPAPDGPHVQCRAWLEWGGHSLLGKGRLALLERVAELGSISAAARDMKVSYHAAWRWIDEMNRAAGQPLVLTATGGKGGGGARLTRLGRALLEAVQVLNDRLVEFSRTMDRELAAFFDESPGQRPRRSRS